MIGAATNEQPYCNFCNKTVKFSNQGLSQILQHAKDETHRKTATQILAGKQTLLNMKGSGVNVMFTKGDDVRKAELIWAMKCIQPNYSYASCDDLHSVLQAMFPGRIPDSFSLGSSKLSYVISDGLGLISKMCSRGT